MNRGLEAVGLEETSLLPRVLAPAVSTPKICGCALLSFTSFRTILKPFEWCTSVLSWSKSAGFCRQDVEEPFSNLPDARLTRRFRENCFYSTVRGKRSPAPQAAAGCSCRTPSSGRPSAGQERVLLSTTAQIKWAPNQIKAGLKGSGWVNKLQTANVH